MTSAASTNYAKRYLQKAEECLTSAEDHLDLERATPAAGVAIHAGISAKDAMVTGMTSKAKDHAKAAGERRTAIGTRPEAAAAEKALRELTTVKGDVEYGATLVTLAKAGPLVRRAGTLVDLAKQIVRPGPLNRSRCGPSVPYRATDGGWSNSTVSSARGTSTPSSRHGALCVEASATICTSSS